MTRHLGVIVIVTIAGVAALVVTTDPAGWGWTWTLLVAALMALVLAAAIVRSVTGRPAGDVDTTPATPVRTLEQELERSRRHRRPCSVARVARVARADDHVRQLTARVRRSDRVWVVGHDLVMVLPETDRTGATRALGRLLDSVELDAQTAVASFPQDALTAHALLEALRSPVAPVLTVRAPAAAFSLVRREHPVQIETSPPA